LKKPKAVVIVINHNGRIWLRRCLSSVAKSDYPNLEVYLVDNGSQDGSIEYARGSFPSVKIIAYERNLGFPEAYNRAIDKVEADFVVLLNSDTEVLDHQWINRLVDVATRDLKTIAVACKMVSMDDHSRLDSVGGMGIPFWRGFVDIGKEMLDRGQYDSDFEPFAFCGGAALINRKMFQKIGRFDGKFFMYVEDADFSWRLRLLGYKVRLAPEARVAHYFSGTAHSKTIDEWKLYYCHRNFLRSMLKNCGPSLGWALGRCLLFSLLAAGGLAIPEPKKSVAIVKAMLWNVLNFRDTYTRRACIQANRTVGEGEVLAKMYPRLCRHQPAQYQHMRHILDILFEHSQLHRFLENAEIT